MKRYTLVFQPISSLVPLEELRKEVDGLLLKLHPRITYKMGQVFTGSDGKLLAQIAMDGKRELLLEVLNNKVWEAPVHFERLIWGWTLENEEATLLASASSPIEIDPLAIIVPIEGLREIQLSKRKLRGRFILLMLSTLVMIFVFIMNALQPRSPLLEGIYLVCFAIFMFSLNDTPIDIRLYAEKITIKQAGIDIYFWMLKKPVSFEWKQIWGMDYSSPICLILSSGRKTRLLISERYGCEEKLLVLKTIVSRAGLLFVEGNIARLTYRKPDSNSHQ